MSVLSRRPVSWRAIGLRNADRWEGRWRDRESALAQARLWLRRDGLDEVWLQGSDGRRAEVEDD